MKTLLMSREFTLMICLCSENSVSNIEDLCFKSLGISGQASNAPGQFHWCFPTIFSESWLSASRIFFLVTIWSNTNIATSLYAQARHLHLFQSQGNFWNRLTLETNVLCFLKKLMRNFGKIRYEFQTAGYLVFLKPYPVAGCVDTASWNEHFNVASFSTWSQFVSARLLVPRMSGKANKSILATYIFKR